MDILLTALATAGVNFVITVPGSDDIMLNYQSLSFHDAHFIRETLGRPPAPEFATWMEANGIGTPDIALPSLEAALGRLRMPAA
jgi:ethanolamine ammonia-lyase large subunit